MSLTSRVLKSGTIVSAALAVAALGSVAAGVMAQNQPPSARVFGSIRLNGANGPAGAVVTAYGGTALCGTAQGNGLYNASTSVYYVDLDSGQTACSTPGNTISFKINGQAANETVAVPAIAGSAVQLNLTGPATGVPATSTATYQTGWNIVGGPSGTTFSQASGPLYQFPAGATNYVAVPNTQAVSAGQGQWAYFTAPTTVNLTGTTTLPITVTAPAGQYIMIANPSSTQTVTVSGADIVYTFDPTVNNYVVATTLTPGHGAWVFSNAGGPITMQ
jgi:hypothetical protein